MYAGSLQQELDKYGNVNAYTPYKGTTITPEEKRRITSCNSMERSKEYKNNNW